MMKLNDLKLFIKSHLYIADKNRNEKKLEDEG